MILPNLLPGLLAGLLGGEGTTSKPTQSLPGLKVSYKQTSICETTQGVKAYAGYVTIPASLDPAAFPYETNAFFWFFEARNSPATAPLTVWLQGGPGAASIDQAVEGHNGPCIVQPDSKTTQLNPNSWNELSNMLYIDQPVQTGFSYDGDESTFVKGIYNRLDGSIDLSGTSSPPAANNYTHVQGTFSSQNPAHLVNSTTTSARALYHVLQGWLANEQFKKYRRDSVHLWGQSYAGHYVPALASLIMKEKANPGSVIPAYKPPTTGCSKANTLFGISLNKPKNTCPSPAISFGVDSVGIINGLIDVGIQLEYYPIFAQNNTYGIQVYNQSIVDSAVQALPACLAQMKVCHALQAESDKDGFATNQTVLQACLGRDPFDIAAPFPISFPKFYSIGYLNQPEVLADLEVKLNFTESSMIAGQTFIMAGDLARNGYIGNLAELADAGVKVALIYGDRDFRCNWFGGEAVSKAMNYSQKDAFGASGYANITVGGAVIGAVRQHGLYSFSRVYNSGHVVPSYKPEASLELFRRTILGKDAATGQVYAQGYSSVGPESVMDVAFPAESLPAPECYVHDIGPQFRCSPAQMEALNAGAAVVKDYIVVDPPFA